ncbi:hypothetical protein ACFSQ7_34100 [Paenibacillus rhizoplanae]
MAIKIAQRHGRNFIAIRVFGSLGYSFFALTIGYLLRALGPQYSVAICIVIVVTALLITIGLKDVKRTEAAPLSVDMESTDKPLKASGLREIFAAKGSAVVLRLCLPARHRLPDERSLPDHQPQGHECRR